MSFNLSEAQQSILKLLLCKGLTPKQIAKELNYETSSIYQRIYEAREGFKIKTNLQLMHKYYADRHFRRLING